MAVHKVTRSQSPAQLQPQHSQRQKTVPDGSPARQRRQPNTQFKAQLFETFHQLNRGYGLAVAALERLGSRTRQARMQASARLKGPAIFPATCVREYREQTEALQALANRDLLRAFAGHEDRDAARFCKKRRK